MRLPYVRDVWPRTLFYRIFPGLYRVKMTVERVSSTRYRLVANNPLSIDEANERRFDFRFQKSFSGRGETNPCLHLAIRVRIVLENRRFVTGYDAMFVILNTFKGKTLTFFRTIFRDHFRARFRREQFSVKNAAYGSNLYPLLIKLPETFPFFLHFRPPRTRKASGTSPIFRLKKCSRSLKTRTVRVAPSP